MIRSTKSYTEAAEKMQPYFTECKKLKSSKNKIILTGIIPLEGHSEEFKVTFLDNEPQTSTERDLFRHIAKQMPEVENFFMCKSLILVEKKVGKKWIDTTQDFVKKIGIKKQNIK